MYLFMCFTPPGQTKKLYRPEIWYTHSPRPHLSTGFCFFEKATLIVASVKKTAVSRGFSAYLLDCLVL